MVILTAPVNCAGCGRRINLAAWRFEGGRPGAWCGVCAAPMLEAERLEGAGIEIPGQLSIEDE